MRMEKKGEVRGGDVQVRRKEGTELRVWPFSFSYLFCAKKEIKYVVYHNRHFLWAITKLGQNVKDVYTNESPIKIANDLHKTFCVM